MWSLAATSIERALIQSRLRYRSRASVSAEGSDGESVDVFDTSVVCLIVAVNEGEEAAAVIEHRHDTRHPGTVEEWVFAAWTPDAQLGVLSGHRIVGATAWYWAALARADRPLLHITDFEVPVRADPFIVKGEAMWAEHFCDAPMQQWSVGNETYAASFDDPDEALGRGYGVPTPIAFDLEWYATERAEPIDSPPDGYRQVGVVHGSVEVLNEATIELVEVPACRWHRWAFAELDGKAPTVGPIPVPETPAHGGVRAPFRFPDGSIVDFVLTPQGWGRRSP
jgi:hypothetical protein